MNPVIEAPAVPDESTPTVEVIRELGMTTVFKGKSPDVPTAPGVDINALTSGVADPVFVTMQIAQIGRRSKNGILYDEALVKEIVDQVNRKRTGGIFGHIPESQRDSAFPLPDAMWVGATLIGDTAYGKAFVRNAAAADYVRHLKAVGGGLGTSIYGLGIHEQVSDGVRRLKNFTLESLDFAPPERASLDMGGQFHLSKEMTTDALSEDTDNMPLNKEQLSGVSATDLFDLLDESVAEQVAQMYAKKKNKKVVAAEMVSQSQDAETRISELTEQTSTQARELNTLRTRVSEYESVEFEAGLTAVINKKIDWKTVDATQEMRVNALRTQLRNQVVAELSGKRDLTLANQHADAIMESDAFRPVAEAVRDALSGGSAIVGGRSTSARESLYERGAALSAEVMGVNRG